MEWRVGVLLGLWSALQAVAVWVSPPGRWGRVLAFRAAASTPPLLADERPLWVHGASVGEMEAVRGLLSALPALPFLVTAGTPEGLARARLDGLAGWSLPLPLDQPSAWDAFLTRVRPRGLVLVEAELWPNLLRACARRSVPVVVAGARMSGRSARRWRRAGALGRQLRASVRMFLAASPADALRLRASGIELDRIAVGGRLKVPETTEEETHRRAAVRRAIRGAPTLVAGSFHRREVTLLRAAVAALRLRIPGLMLVVAPRHPDRWEPWEGSLRFPGAGLPLAAGTDVWVAEMGWLRALYAEAPLALVGGGWGSGAAHDVLEPLLRRCRVVVGPGEDGADETVLALSRQGLVQVVPPDAVSIADALWAAWNAGPPDPSAVDRAVHLLDGRARTAEWVGRLGLLGTAADRTIDGGPIAN